MGTPEFAVPILQTLIAQPQLEVAGVITQPDKPAGRQGTPQPSPIKQLALTNNLTVWTPNKVKNNPEIIGQIKAVNPDVIIVAAYGKILPQEILDIPKYGIINIHGSLLPKYRGASPVATSIINGDATTGVTLMKMVFEMDAGPIIAKSEPVTIEPNDTTASLTTKLSDIGAKLLDQKLISYLEGRITPTPQDDQAATYVKLVAKEDGLINWEEEATIIERKTRAYSPWPSAYTFWEGKRLKIITGEVVPETQGQPGQVWIMADHYPAVDTGQDSLKLITVQPEGKLVMSGADFLRGHPGLSTTRLGKN